MSNDFVLKSWNFLSFSYRVPCPPNWRRCCDDFLCSSWIIDTEIFHSSVLTCGGEVCFLLMAPVYSMYSKAIKVLTNYLINNVYRIKTYWKLRIIIYTWLNVRWCIELDTIPYANPKFLGHLFWKKWKIYYCHWTQLDWIEFTKNNEQLEINSIFSFLDELFNLFKFNDIFSNTFSHKPLSSTN